MRLRPVRTRLFSDERGRVAAGAAGIFAALGVAAAPIAAGAQSDAALIAVCTGEGERMMRLQELGDGPRRAPSDRRPDGLCLHAACSRDPRLERAGRGKG